MKRIGPYAINGLLGTGGMSRVYKVVIPRIAKPAAVKFLSPHPHLVQLMGAATIRHHFEREAITMARIRHRHITEVWDYDEHRGQPFYLMDYFDDNLALLMGESLRPDAPSRILPVPRAGHTMHQILDGLERLHQAGIVHRDIKPFNILISGHDTVKICDLGLSIHRGERFNAPSQLKIGSPWYAAPEQNDGPDEVDPRADLFSAGVVLYRMLTGQLPDRQQTPASALNPLLDAAWDGFLKTAMARSPAHRHCNAQTMRNDLNRLMAGWHDTQDAACRFVPPKTSPRHFPLPLRSQGIKVPLAHGPSIFGTDALFRPVRHCNNLFIDDPRGIIVDRATGKVWQRSGSEFPLNRSQADDYILDLNTQGFADANDWRLPTVDELLTLLDPPTDMEAFCIKPVFDPTQRTLWSIDRCTFTADWYVSADLGFAARREKTGCNFVRAVRDR